jgi:hypothetical protein
MNTIIFILWLIHNPGIGGKEDDLAVEAFPTLQACEDERKSGEFAERFRCLPATGREAAYAALLFSRLASCESDDERCNNYKMELGSVQRRRHPHGPTEMYFNRWFGW